LRVATRSGPEAPRSAQGAAQWHPGRRARPGGPRLGPPEGRLRQRSSSGAVSAPEPNMAPLGRVAGVLVAFLIPFLDLGLAQDPILHATPPTWARLLPSYGGFRLLTNAILTHGPIQGGPLLIALTWLTGAAAAATLLFRHNMRTAGQAHSAAQAGRVTG